MNGSQMLATTGHYWTVTRMNRVSDVNGTSTESSLPVPCTGTPAGDHDPSPKTARPCTE